MDPEQREEGKEQGADPRQSARGITEETFGMTPSTTGRK